MILTTYKGISEIINLGIINFLKRKFSLRKLVKIIMCNRNIFIFYKRNKHSYVYNFIYFYNFYYLYFYYISVFLLFILYKKVKI